MLTVKASDLKFKYRKYIETRDEPKFQGLPDPVQFNRDDLYEILPMMEAAMNALDSVDGRVLNMLEDLLNDMPRFISTRGEVFDYLVGSGKESLRY
jgi:hypothetical protein